MTNRKCPAGKVKIGNKCKKQRYCIYDNFEKEIFKNNMSEQEIIDYANDCAYPDRIDNDEPEIDNFRDAKQYSEMGEEWNVVNAK
jgi:hypothetical protein